jgi:hypothetical protein
MLVRFAFGASRRGYFFPGMTSLIWPHPHILMSQFTNRRLRRVVQNEHNLIRSQQPASSAARRRCDDLGRPTGLARLTPATLAYGGAHGFEEEQRAVETSLAAGVTLFDTAEIYSGGASERRLGELTRSKDVVIATKFPPSFFSRVDSLPSALDASLARLGRSWVDLYQHHFPFSWIYAG